MTDKPDVVVLSVKLESGDFECSLRMPIDATSDEMNRTVASWLVLIETGLKIGATRIAANLRDPV